MRTWIWTVLIFAASLFAADCKVLSLQPDSGLSRSQALRFQKLLGEDCAEAEKLLQELVAELSEEGHPFARANVIADSAGFATVRIERGAAFVWAEAENLEASKTKRWTFGKLSGLTSGDLVKLSDLERAERKLVNSGYFESTASVKLFRDSVRNRLVPAFSMRDLPINSFEGVISYASGDDGGWAGNLDLNLYNIRGTGRDLTASGETGEWERALSFSYKEPWLLGTDWNGIVRGSFEEDSTYRTALLEAGLSRSIGFFFEFALLGGIGPDRLTYTLETRYKNEDRIVLPRHGATIESSLRIERNDSDTAEAYLVELKTSGRILVPVSSSLVLQASFSAGTLLPTFRNFSRSELFSLGGIESIKGYRPGFFRTRAYGFTEADLQWHAFDKTAFHLFFEPGLHRAERPAHGWEDSYSYGIGISQYRGTWSFSLYYALSYGNDPLDGLLHFGVKALF